MLRGANEFLETLAMERLLYVCGHFGAHKTSFAVYLGMLMAERGYSFVSPIRCLLNEYPYPQYKGRDIGVRAYMVLDEGGLWYRTRQEVDTFGAYLAKLDVYVVIPSKVEPHESFQALVCQPVRSWRDFGVPVVQFKWWHAHGGQADEGSFDWFGPGDAYGVYDRTDPSGRQVMQDLLKVWVWDMQVAHGQRERVGIDFGLREGRIKGAASTAADRQRERQDEVRTVAGTSGTGTGNRRGGGRTGRGGGRRG